MPKKQNDSLSDEEVQRRAEIALRAAFHTPHKPMREIPRKIPNKSQKKAVEKDSA